MRELYRRAAVMVLMFIGLSFFFTPREGFVRIRAADLEKEYLEPRGSFRKSAASGTLEDYVSAQTAGRLITVEGGLWPEIFAGATGPAVPAFMAWREGRGGLPGNYFFSADEVPFDALIPLPSEGGGSFAYLKLAGADGNLFLGMTLTGPSDAIWGKAPKGLVFPRRYIAPWFFLGALAIYVLIRRKKTPPGAIVYPKWSAVILPDIISYALTGLFLALPMVLTVQIYDKADYLDFAYGNGWLTVVLWLMAMIPASILWWSAGYASFALQILPGEFCLRTLSRETRLSFSEITGAKIVDYNAPKWLRRALFIGGFFNFRLMGQALLISSRSDWGIELSLRDGGRERFLCSHLPGADRLINALRANKIPIEEDIGEKER